MVWDTHQMRLEGVTFPLKTPDLPGAETVGHGSRTSKSETPQGIHGLFAGDN